MSRPALICAALLRSEYLTPLTWAIQVGVSPPFICVSNMRKRTFWNLLFTRLSTSSILALFNSSIANSSFSRSAICCANSFSRLRISSLRLLFFSITALTSSCLFTSSSSTVMAFFGCKLRSITFGQFFNCGGNLVYLGF